MASNEKSNLECSPLVLRWIAVHRVVQAEILLDKSFAPVDALSNRVTGQFEVHAAKERVMLFVDLESGRRFVEDNADSASFGPSARSLSRRKISTILVNNMIFESVATMLDFCILDGFSIFSGSTSCSHDGLSAVRFFPM